MQWGFRVTEGTWSPETSNDCCDDSGAGASRGPDRHWLNSFDLCSVQAQLSASMRQCYWSQEWSIDQGVCFSFCSLLTEMIVFLFVQVSNFILRKKVLNGHDWQLDFVQCNAVKTHSESEKNNNGINHTFISCGKLPHQSASKMDLEFSDVSERKNITSCLLCLNSVFVYFLH